MDPLLLHGNMEKQKLLLDAIEASRFSYQNKFDIIKSLISYRILYAARIGNKQLIISNCPYINFENINIECNQEQESAEIESFIRDQGFNIIRNNDGTFTISW